MRKQPSEMLGLAVLLVALPAVAPREDRGRDFPRPNQGLPPIPPVPVQFPGR